MYTRKGDDQQASYRLGNLNLFIRVIDCGYSLDSFNDAHEKVVILQLIKRLMLNFPDQLLIGRNRERGGYFCQCPSLRLNSIDLKNLVHTFLLEHTEYGFSLKC